MLTEARGSRHFERVLFLRRLPALQMLSGPDLALLAESLRERFFPRGSVLLQEGEPVAAAHIVVSGDLRLTRRGQALGGLRPGEILGGLQLVARDPEGLGAVAESDTLTLEIEADAVHELFEERFPILLSVMRQLCRRLVQGLLSADCQSIQPPSIQVPLRPPQRSLDLVERLVLLRAFPVFARASITSLADLARTMQEVRYERGVQLWREGDAASWLLLPVEGRVACCDQVGCFQLDAGPGVPLGVVEALADLPRWYSAQTVTPLLALRGRPDELIDVFEDNHRMGADFLAGMAQDLLRIEGRAGSLSPEVGGEGRVGDS